MSKMFSEIYSGTHRGFDAGLRAYMLKIYSLMSIALVISGATAFAVMNIPAFAEALFRFTPNGYVAGYTGLGFLVAFAPVGIAFYFFMGAGRMDLQKAQALFWVYAALTGMSLASLGFLYTSASIAKTFFITASAFGAMSIYGYTTNRDLTSFGSFLVMGMIGIIVASLVNIFMQSPAIDFVVSFLGVGIFLGITAWDTQRLKAIYYSAGSGEYAQRMAVVGAFTLYLDFINLFLYLIRFFGVRREN